MKCLIFIQEDIEFALLCTTMTCIQKKANFKAVVDVGKDGKVINSWINYKVANKDSMHPEMITCLKSIVDELEFPKILDADELRFTRIIGIKKN